MVIEEVSAIQEDLEIERTCRESAEALASKVHFIFRQILSTILLTMNQLSVVLFPFNCLSKPGFKLDLSPIKDAHNTNHIIKLKQESV